MTWFEVGDKAEWENKKGITICGEIIAILGPGEIAEDVLNENERTKISTRNLGAEVTPLSTRALVKVVDENKWITYHTVRLGRMRKTEQEPDVTITDLYQLLKEMRELMETKNVRLHTVGR